jgi:hypothetical protein
MNMERQPDGQFQRVTEALVRGWSVLIALVAFVILIPLTLWFTWRRASTFALQIADTLFCVAFAWGMVSTLRMLCGLRKLGLSPSNRMRIFSGPRPDDPAELHAWKWAWQFLYAIIAVGLCMISIPIASWLSGQ